MRAQQDAVDKWMRAAFGGPGDTERVPRFVEEAMELAQAAGLDKEGAHAVVDYVFSRPVGDIGVEAGDAIVTYLALLSWLKVDAAAAFSEAMARIWRNIERIRAKQQSKRVSLERLKADRAITEDAARNELAAVRLFLKIPDKMTVLGFLRAQRLADQVYGDSLLSFLGNPPVSDVDAVAFATALSLEPLEAPTHLHKEDDDLRPATEMLEPGPASGNVADDGCDRGAPSPLKGRVTDLFSIERGERRVTPNRRMNPHDRRTGTRGER